MLTGYPEKSLLCGYCQPAFLKNLLGHKGGVEYPRKTGVRRAVQDGFDNLFGGKPHVKCSIDVNGKLRFAAAKSGK
ncbi:hypothetical protein D3C74_420520 [compost metagenome]